MKLISCGQIQTKTTRLVQLTLMGLTAQAFALPPLVSSSEEIQEQQTQRLFRKFDKNKDQKIDKSENVKVWNRNARYDANKDSALSVDELKASFVPSMGAPGKELVNVKYKQTEQGDVHLDIFFPDQDTNKAKPVVFFTHGGGWAAGNKSKATQASFSEVHKAWLKEGFVVVSVGYRLIGKTKETAIRDCVIDCKDGMRFIAAHKEALGIDPTKFYTFGDSAGGHLAMMLLHTDSKTFVGDSELSKYQYSTVAGVSWYGPCDFQDIQLFNYNDAPDFNDRFNARIISKHANAENKQALYKEVSPISYLTENSAPLLMIQGDKDTTIPLKQALRMQKELETVKAPVQISIIKNAGHNWRSVKAPIAPTLEHIVQQTIDFILKYKK